MNCQAPVKPIKALDYRSFFVLSSGSSFPSISSFFDLLLPADDFVDFYAFDDFDDFETLKDYSWPATSPKRTDDKNANRVHYVFLFD